MIQRTSNQSLLQMIRRNQDLWSSGHSNAVLYTSFPVFFSFNSAALSSKVIVFLHSKISTPV